MVRIGKWSIKFRVPWVIKRIYGYKETFTIAGVPVIAAQFIPDGSLVSIDEHGRARVAEIPEWRIDPDTGEVVHPDDEDHH